jgi:hypothetical protein
VRDAHSTELTRKYLCVNYPCFYMTLPEFILGCAKYMQPNEITMIFNFYKLLDKQITQCFASIRMSNISWAQGDFGG